MGLWHVFYADWQMECCGTPFSVGEEVSWPLLLADAGDVLGGGWHDQLTKITGTVEDLPGDAGAVRVVRDETGLTVALHRYPVDVLAAQDLGETVPGDWIRSVGLLSVERHAEEWPETVGRVRAVQVLTQGFAETAPGSRTSVPVRGERRLRSVRRCPKWFADRPVEPGSDGRERRRAESGVVVTLEVPGTDSWLSHAVRRARGIPQQGAAPGAETEGVPEEDLVALLESLSTVPGPSAGPGLSAE